LPEKISDHNINLACFAAAIVLQHDQSAREILAALRDAGIEREAVREAILQTYLFDGYPTALEGMILLSELWQGEPEPVESGDFNNWNDWYVRGKKLYERIYGDVAETLLERAHEVSPELANWMIVEGYGKVLSRNVLDIKTREIIIIAVLVVKNRPRQLHSHIRGALRVGVSKQELLQLFDTLQSRFDPPSFENSKSLLHQIIKEIRN